MFNRTTKQIVINMDKMELFTTCLVSSGELNVTHRFIMKMTRFETPSGEDIAVLKFIGIPNNMFDGLVLKMNKYGVEFKMA